MFEDYLRELDKVKILEPDEESELWRRFKNENDRSARLKIIESYQPLVFKIALPYRDLQSIMDVIQEGTVGLIESVEKFEPERGVAFSLFAIHRIRGRMIDYLKREKEIPTNEEIFLDLADSSPTAQDLVESSELAAQLHTAINRLPRNEKNVIQEMYLNDENASELASDMKLSISHIYRLQKKGMQRIRGMLSRFISSW
ncbi:MAG: sigma-70 family RNA polymerase sigma factor [Selenomonadaceae bacterium]|nr:sigma-70 family RNA polymerase sigma factor [Selenomonadaceae bacterium]